MRRRNAAIKSWCRKWWKMPEELYFKTATELSEMLGGGSISSEELTRVFIERTEAVDEKIHAFLHRDSEDALAQARASDQRRAAGAALGPLDGIPIGLKDVLCVKDQPLTCASKILQDYISPYDGTVVRKLRESGLVLYGKLNLDEFAMGSSTENSAYGATSNPWNLDCIPGGSSGASAAAVAAGEVPWTLGSDTGGSIRQPAALCGTVGLKPTYGLVSRFGLAAFASSLDQIGPFARTVEDAALLLQVIAGQDPLDSTSFRTEIPDYRAALSATPARPLVLGIPREYFAGEGLEPEVRVAVENAIRFYEENGAEIREISLPHTELALAVYYIIATAECSSNLARYDGIRYTTRAEGAEDGIDLYAKTRGEGFGAEVKRRIILGTYVLSSGYYDAYYLRAQKVRTLIRRDFTEAFESGVDAVLTPTSPTVAFRKGERSADPIRMYLSDIFTINTNLAGLPGISVNCGFSEEGLPIGLQLIGKPFAEAELLAAAHRFDAAHDYHARTPSL